MHSPWYSALGTTCPRPTLTLCLPSLAADMQSPAALTALPPARWSGRVPKETPTTLPPFCRRGRCTPAPIQSTSYPEHPSLAWGALSRGLGFAPPSSTSPLLVTHPAYSTLRSNPRCSSPPHPPKSFSIAAPAGHHVILVRHFAFSSLPPCPEVPTSHHWLLHFVSLPIPLQTHLSLSHFTTYNAERNGVGGFSASRPRWPVHLLTQIGICVQ